MDCDSDFSRSQSAPKKIKDIHRLLRARLSENSDKKLLIAGKVITMSYTGIASQIGTTSANIEKLIRNGEGSPGLASAIGTTSSNLTDFVDGRASPGIASALGTTTANAQHLRDAIGREGAIGLLLGLASGLKRR